MTRSEASGSFEGLLLHVVEVIGGHGTAFPLESRVPVVLDSVICTAVEEARDGGPLVAESRVCPDYLFVLVGSEGSVFDLRRELVAPSQPA